jgi:hypothetical protein
MAVTTFSVAVSADDGAIVHYDDSPPTDWPPTAVIEDWSIHVGLTQMEVAKTDDASISAIQVSFARFLTSSLGSGAVVTDAVLKIWFDSLVNADGRNLVVEWYTPGAWPPVDADWSENVGTTAGSFPLSGLTDATVNSLTLTNPSNVNVTGYTSLRLGISGGQPTGFNRIRIAQFDHATEQEPRLEVTTADAATTEFLSTAARMSYVG